jgi:adenylate cyclase
MRHHPQAAVAANRFRITRRELRLGTGIVLFTYVTVHLFDHALGLFSVNIAEQALRLAVAVWQSAPGTAVLYGAAGIHIALAFIAVYERRTLRMPPMQALRIALGFGMPLLLIGHAVATRIAAEIYALTPTYTRVVWALWTSESEGRQLALLAPGWLHGCLGIDFAFGRRALYQRMRPALFGAALLLPVLAALGFLAMGRELAALAALGPGWQKTAEVADTMQRIALGRLRDGLLFAYLALIGLVFTARAMRDRLARRKKALVSISYPERAVEVPLGWSVLEASRGFGIPHLSMCGGNARCSTCRVRIVSGREQCPPPSSNEQRTLDRIGAAPNVRLACQLRPTGPVGVVPLLDAKATAQPGCDASPPVIEREVALLLVDVVGWAGPTRVESSHDLVYASNLALAIIGDGIAAAGGVCTRCDTEGAVAVFGIAVDLPTACRQALDAARSIEHDLSELNARLVLEFGFAADVALVVHAGPAAIGAIGYGPNRATQIVGSAMYDARRLRATAVADGQRFIASVVALGRAGANDRLAQHTLDGDAREAALVYTAGTSVHALLPTLAGLQ